MASRASGGEVVATRPVAERTPAACLHRLFEARAALFPDAIALTFEGRHLSYAELNARAERLARALRGMGVGPEVPVALFVERSFEIVVGILAILKAGGAYVPLDPAYPTGRLRLILDDVRAAALLTQASLLARLPQGIGPVVLLDDDRAVEALPAVDLRGGASPKNLAYIIYTSGSTGRPKGVGVTHANASRLLTSTERRFGFDAGDVWTLFHSFAFDFSVWEIWGALAYGGRLVIVPYWVSRSPEAFLDLLIAERVTVLNQTPSAFRQLARADEASRNPAELSLRYVIFGGEALDLASLAGWFDRHGDDRPRLINMYGITETTVHATYRPIVAADLLENPGSSPIGGPIDDLRLLLLDSRMRPVPLGAVGEIYVGGAGVARGYLGRPALTAERFVPDPFSKRRGARLYRSGDQARRRADGEIEYVGRADHQVKIRGFRIELGDIESALSSHPEVREVVVVACEGRSEDDRRLVAYVACRANPPDASQLKSWLTPRLPAYMIPSGFVRLDALPLTPNGKVDREALPADDAGRAAILAPFEAPRDDVEAAIAEAWTAVLGVDRIGIRDHFFDLGGHSLLATRAVSRLRERLGIDLPLRTLFESPTVAALAERIEQLRNHPAAPPSDAIPPRPAGEPAPPSFAQQAMWYLDRLSPDRPTFHVTASFRIAGPLDLGALSRGFQALIARHESLRTSFRDEDGRPTALIHETLEVAVDLVDLTPLGPGLRAEEAESRIAESLRRPFNLATAPLVRLAVVRLDEEDHAIGLTMHHIVTDGWSLGVAAAEWSSLYEAFRAGRPSPLPPLAIQYGDYARWQRERMRGETLARLTAYWTDRLEGVPPLELPLDRPRPPVRGDRGGVCPFMLSGPASDRVRSTCRERGVTPFMLFLAAYEVLLARYSGRDDFAIGTPVANRPRVELEGLIGYFVNMLALRADLRDDPTFGDFLIRVRESSLSAFEHQELPFDLLVEAVRPPRDPSRTPIFQAMMVLQNTLMPDAASTSLNISSLGVTEGTGTAKFDLSLGLVESDGGFSGSFEYAADLFDKATIGRMCDHFVRLVESAISDPSQPVSRLAMSDEAERDRVLHHWNATEADFARDTCLHDLIAEQAARTPDAVAMVAGPISWTYSQLVEEGRGVAAVLRARGVRPETRVGLFLDPCPEMAAGLLGILQAGAAYVPLEPSFPAHRIARMIEDAGVSLLLTRRGLRGELPATSAEILDLDDLPAAGASGASQVSPENAAYLLYTSGTSGTPRGVVVPHRALVNHNVAAARLFGLTPEDRVLQFGSLAFDLAAEEIFPAWISGSAVVLREEAHRDTSRLSDLIGRDGITVVDLPTAFWHAWVRDLAEAGRALPACLRLVVVGGEEASASSLATWQGLAPPGVRWINTYGPTEATIIATAYEAKAAIGGRVPIGRPIANVRAYVLDAAMNPTPIGVPGELYLGGEGLARGYHGRPAETAERFVPDPFGSAGRLYRTGDRARRLVDGELEFLGRVDDQVKIRGYRVEPGEIESALRALPGVSQAMVFAVDGAAGDPALSAYVVGDSVAPDSLLSALRGRLPRAMIPSSIHVLAALPLTPTGKVDRRALAAIRREDLPEGARRPPADDWERRLIAAFEDLLGVRPVGPADDFFDLGGHSLLAVRLLATIRRETGREVALSDLLRWPTVEGLAALVRDGRGTRDEGRRGTPLVPIQEGTRAPLFCVHPAGGVAYGFLALARSLGDDQAVFGLRAAGLDGEQEPLQCVGAMADSYIEAIRRVRPQGPYHLAGWSLGGLVAFEMARRLAEAGEEVQALALIDIPAPTAGDYPLPGSLRRRAGEIADLGLFGSPSDGREDDALVLSVFAGEMYGNGFGGLDRWLDRLKAMAIDARRAEVLRHFRLDQLYLRDASHASAESLLRVLRANVLAGLRYKPSSPYLGRVTVFSASQRGRIDPSLGWGRLTPGGAIGHVIAGDHSTILAEPGVRKMAAILRREMDRSGGAAS